ncbi:MAG: hypothetical protein ACE5J2_01200 [Nitrososphaerales archaeon]
MGMDLFLLVMIPFWTSMVFINGKLILELNREWDKEDIRKEEIV